MKVATLTTDFGLEDWFVGVMKGVVLKRAPRVAIVDVTHGIPLGDIRAGAFALWAAFRFFPAGSIHVAVVDPGVGSARAALAVQTEHCCFLAPDNGILSFALRLEPPRSVRRIENRRIISRPVSCSFHGRDVFAPAAGFLANGGTLDKLGPATEASVWLPWPEPRQHRHGWRGEVVYVDRFGNAITNLGLSQLSDREQVVSKTQPCCAVALRNGRQAPFGTQYQEVPPGCPVVIVGSTGLLEIALNGGHAAPELGLKVGDRVTLRAALGERVRGKRARLA
jgi:S-adenosylmethionine hydrolase